MTFTTSDAIYTLLKYEQTPPSFPWFKRDKTILIQSDSEMLAQIITDSLQRTCHPMPSYHINVASAPASVNLIILALSGPQCLPVFALTRANIARQVGKTPMLILSQQQFGSDDVKRLYHLPLPVQPAALRHQVQRLLG